MTSARRIVASALGISAGIAGVEHGYFEVLQGNARPDSVMIASMGPPCVPEEVWNACEPAMTVIPNFLVTGVLAIIVGLIVLIWSAGFIQRRGGGLVMILLSIALLLVGGGLFPPLIGIIGGIVAAKIRSPLAWWRARSSRAGVRLLALLWPWALIVYLAWVSGQWVVGYFFNDWLMRNGFLIFVLVLGPLVLSVFSGLAHDALRRKEAEGGSDSMKALVVYDSVYGNTEQIAQAIGDGLGKEGSVLAVRVSDVTREQLEGLDLLVVGSPTQRFTSLPSVNRFLKGIPNGGLQGVKVAAFDTRATVSEIKKVRILAFFVRIFGYAAEPILNKLEKKGGEPVAPAEGFFVGGTEGPLTEGELERAAGWAKRIAGV